MPFPLPAIPIERLRAVAAAVANTRRLDLVVLFGSAARPAHTRPPEDLDLAVRTDTGSADLVSLTNAFTARLGVQAVDLVDVRRASPLLLALVARDGVPLDEARPGAFAEFCSLAVRRFADTRKFRDATRDEVRDALRAAGHPP